MQKWMTALALIGALGVIAGGCKKSGETESAGKPDSVDVAETLLVNIRDGATWTAVKVFCEDDSWFEVYPVTVGTAYATELPSDDCRMSMMPGSIRVERSVREGMSFTCVPARGGGAECTDDYKDALVVQVTGGDFKSAHVECQGNGLDKKVVLEGGSAVVHGVAGACMVSFNPGEVPSNASVTAGQELRCTAEESRIASCNTR
jgi:hypothetical protein